MKKNLKKVKNIFVISLICLVIVGTIATFVPLILIKKQKNTMLETPTGVGLYQVLDKFYVDVEEVKGAKQYFFTISPPKGDDLVLFSPTNQLEVTQIMFTPGVYYVKCYVKGETDNSRSLQSEYFMYTRYCEIETPVLVRDGNNLKWNDVEHADYYVLTTTSLSGSEETIISSEDITKENGYVIYSLAGKTYPPNTTFYVQGKSEKPHITASNFSNPVSY